MSQNSNVLQKYTYDETQQLIREDNAELNQSFTYSYDNHGNILAKEAYAFTTGSLGSAIETIPYAYADASWPDMLTGLGNAQIVSDSMGNPIAVMEPGQPTKRFFWTAGRQLAHVMTMTAKKRADLVSYTYDAMGMMTSKTVSKLRFRHAPNVDAAANKDNWSLDLFHFSATEQEFTSYAWTGDLKLRTVTHGNGTTVRILYDEAKEPFGIALQSGQSVQTLLYEKNPQGDIISLINPLDGSEIACYTYDAFGNMTATADSPNPLYYRGYLYDPDIDMYYLKTRFYNPQWGRFLNADMLFDTGTGLLGTNMFAYCDNNPVNKVDITGMWGASVHHGRDANGNPRKHTNGITYGTYQWARDMGYGHDGAVRITDGNRAVDDAWVNDAPRKGGMLLDYYAMSWHMNNTFGYINPIVTDAREWRALGNLIEVDFLLQEATKYYQKGEVGDIIAAAFAILFSIHHLGYATHPMQDMTGHGDDYVRFSPRLGMASFGLLPNSGTPVWNHGGNGDIFTGPSLGADDITKEIVKDDNIRLYHWDDVLWARDLTYDILGRFAWEYEKIALMMEVSD